MASQNLTLSRGFPAVSSVPCFCQRFESHNVEVKVNAPHGSSELNHVRRPKTLDKIVSSSFSSFWFCSSIALNFCLLVGNASATNGVTAPMKGKSSKVFKRSVGLASNAYTNENTLPI